MSHTFSRRSLIKGVAGGTVALTMGSKASRTFAAPAVVQSTGSTVTVKYWTAFGGGVNGTAQKKLVDDFHASQKDIKIKMEAQPSYEDLASSLTANLQTGNAPDLAVLSDVWWFRFYLSQSIADLTPLIKKVNLNTSDYVQSLYKDYSRHGGQWALPFARSTPLFYYNKKAVDAAGLTPEVFNTWSGFAAQAPKFLGKETKYAFGHGNAASYGAWFLQGPMWAFGGHYSDPQFDITITKPNALACGEFFRKSVEDKWAVCTANPTTDFSTGLTAATIASTGSMGTIKNTAAFEFGAAFLPTEKSFGCCTGGAGLSILAKSPDEVKQAALTFIDFCTNTQNTAQWSQATGYMPVRTSAIDSATMQDYYKNNPNFEVAAKQLPKTSPQDSARVFIPDGDQIIGHGWEQILVNNVSASDAFGQVKQQLDQDKVPVLAQIKKLEG